MQLSNWFDREKHIHISKWCAAGYIDISFLEDTVFKVLPLADQYQVSTIKKRCESFIIQTLQKVNSRESQGIDINTLLKYIFNVDMFQLSEALPLAVQLCAKHCLESVTKASEETPISEEVLGKICKERVKLVDTLVKNKMEKGIICFLLVYWTSQRWAMISKETYLCPSAFDSILWRMQLH